MTDKTKGTNMKKRATKTKLELAKNAVDNAKLALDVNETIWNEEWKAKANPFVAASWYLSPPQRERRSKFLRPLIAAKAAYELIKPTNISVVEA